MTTPTLTILITGASSGFGEATARALAEAGHHLVLVARRGDRLAELAKSLDTDVHIVAADVTDRAAMEQLLSELPPAFAAVDVLINNAGLALGVDTVDTASLDDWEQMVDTNIKGLLYTTHPVVRQMKQRGSGLIINIGSVASFLAYRGANVYGATKAFVRQFSRNLRADLHGTGIKVTNIEPGRAETEFGVVRFRDEAKAKAEYAGTNPLTAEDVAQTIAWVINQPPHVNIDNIEIWPLSQTYGGAALKRDSQT